MSEETETPNSQEQEQSGEQTPDSLIGDKPEGAEDASEEEAPEEAPEEAEEFAPLSADDLSFSEDFEVQDEIRDNFLEIMNDREMSPKDRAQALVDLQQKVALEASETVSRQWVDQQKQWQDEVKNDEKMGGANFQSHLQSINSLVEQYGSDDLVEVFRLTGAGNNVHVHRFLSKIAEVALEGKPVSGQPQGNEPTRAQKLFPSMKG